MRQAQVRGCLPALLMLLLLGALVALVISFSLAVALPVAGALLLVGLARSIWYRITGRQPRPIFRVTTLRNVGDDPGWTGEAPRRAGAEDGPVVDALPRAPRSGAPGQGQGEPDPRAPERLPGPGGPDRSDR